MLSQFKKVLFSLFIFQMFVFGAFAQEHGREIILVGDIEGVYAHWQTLVDRGVISWDNKTNEWKITSDRYILAFLGDYTKRGPYGKRTVRWILDLQKNYSNQTMVLLGNHDINPLVFLTLKPSLEMGKIAKYNEWLKKTGSSNTTVNQINWWAQNWGVKDKIENYWIEIVADKLKMDPSSEEFLKIVQEIDPKSNKLKISTSKLGSYISENDMVDSFMKFISPGGDYWKLQQSGRLMDVLSTNQGKRLMFLHSGQPTAGNLGVTPGNSHRAQDSVKNKSDWPIEWRNQLEIWKQDQIKRIADKLKSFQNEKNSEVRVALAQEIINLRLPKYGDAGWDEKLQKMTNDANSTVYPDKAINRYNSLPAIPTQNEIDILAEGLISYVIGGHVPTGDSATWRVGFSQAHNKMIKFILADTSFSPVEGKDHISLFEDGTIRLNATTRDGMKFVVDYPSEETLNEMQRSSNSETVEHAKKIKKVGMVVNGALILGFATKTDANGMTVADYSNFITVNQKGYNFEYTKIDEWGLAALEKAHGLRYANADLSKLYSDAHNEKIEMLKKSGKEHIDEAMLLSTLKGKNIYVSSGPANNSYDPIRAYPEGKEASELYLKNWRSFLLNIPLNENWVFGGGGTHGLEQVKNEIVAEVSKIRVSQGGSPFELFGGITGVTSSDELDPNVSKFIVLDAHYWEDYWPKLMKVLSKAVEMDSKTNVIAEFAAGGSILPKQIKHSVGLKLVGDYFSEKIKIFLAKGLNPQGKTSGTDAEAKSAMANLAVEPNVTVVKMTENGFKSVYGNDKILERSNTALTVVPKKAVETPQYITTWKNEVRTQSNAVGVTNSLELANAIIEYHAKSSGGKGNIVVVNNLGASDSEYKNKDEFVKLVQNQIRNEAKSAGANSLIVVLAGNTNSGIGRAVTAVQDPDFVNEIRSKFGVEIKTGGISSLNAAMKHREYGGSFMNNALDFTMLVNSYKDDKGESTWYSKSNVNDISHVSRFSITQSVLGLEKGLNIKSQFVLREGGQIALQEAFEFLLTMNQINQTGVYIDENGQSHKVDRTKLRELVSLTLEIGHEPGNTAKELVINKGPSAATDFAMLISSAGRDVQNILQSTTINVREINPQGEEIKFSANANIDVFKRISYQVFQTADGQRIVNESVNYNRYMQNRYNLEKQLYALISTHQDEEAKSVAEKIVNLDSEVVARYGKFDFADLKKRAKNPDPNLSTDLEKYYLFNRVRAVALTRSFLLEPLRNNIDTIVKLGYSEDIKLLRDLNSARSSIDSSVDGNYRGRYAKLDPARKKVEEIIDVVRKAAKK